MNTIYIYTKFSISKSHGGNLFPLFLPTSIAENLARSIKKISFWHLNTDIKKITKVKKTKVAC